MKIFNKKISGNSVKVLHQGTKIFHVIIAMVFTISFANVASAQRIGVNVNITIPLWAPHYENTDLIQYYYLPDIECFYDVWNQEFVYLEDGNWMFGATLPSIYSWYDLNTAFVVVLDKDVFEPWMHFHYYVAHYPRYYYRSVYKSLWSDPRQSLRGFNENSKVVVYNRPGVKQGPPRKYDFPERRVEPTRPSRPMEYRGNEIGQPVRVEPSMRRPQGGKRR